MGKANKLKAESRRQKALFPLKRLALVVLALSFLLSALSFLLILHRQTNIL